MSNTNNIPDPVQLHSLAQNDYNIDGNLLPDGVMLCEIADRIEQTEALLREAKREIELLKKKNQNQAMLILSRLDEENGL